MIRPSARQAPVSEPFRRLLLFALANVPVTAAILARVGLAQRYRFRDQRITPDNDAPMTDGRDVYYHEPPSRFLLLSPVSVDSAPSGLSGTGGPAFGALLSFSALASLAGAAFWSLSLGCGWKTPRTRAPSGDSPAAAGRLSGRPSAAPRRGASA